MSFKLPGPPRARTKVQIAWMDESGRAGLRFIDVPKESRPTGCLAAEQCEKMAATIESLLLFPPDFPANPVETCAFYLPIRLEGNPIEVLCCRFT